MSDSAIPTTILINPDGGTAQRRGALEQLWRLLEQRLPAAAVEVLEPQHVLAERVHHACAGGAKLLVAAGGDGTINGVAQALVGTDRWLGVLPFGTKNHFASTIGVPAQLEGAVELLRAPQARRVDVGQLNQRYFLDNACIGLYPEIIELRGRQRSLASKTMHLLRAAWQVLWAAQPFSARLSADQLQLQRRVWMVFVGNNEYSLDPLHGLRRRRLDQARLDVIVLHPRRRLSIATTILTAQCGRLRTRHMTRLPLAWLTVEPQPAIAYEVMFDGETARMQPPFRFRSVPQALWVVAPAQEHSA